MGSLFSTPPAADATCVHNARIAKTHAALSAQLQTQGRTKRPFAPLTLGFAHGQPGFYADSPWSLPPNAVRCLTLPIDDRYLNTLTRRRKGMVALQAAAALAAAMPIETGIGSHQRAPCTATILHCGSLTNNAYLQAAAHRGYATSAEFIEARPHAGSAAKGA